MLSKHVHRFLGFILIGLSVFLFHCGGEDSSSSADNIDDVNFDISPDPSSDLASLAVNTFVTNGIAVHVDPKFLEYPDTTFKKSVKETFIISNDSKSDYKFNFEFSGITSGFSFINTDKKFSTIIPLNLKSGDSQKITLNFDAGIMGTRTGFVKITAEDTKGIIKIPVRAKVKGPANFRMVTLDYLCSNKKAPTTSDLDFGRTASKTSKVLSIKFCNTGGAPLKINSIRIDPYSGNLESMAVNTDFFKDFLWDVDSSFNKAYFDYYNPAEDSSFTDPSIVTFKGILPDPRSAYNVTAKSGSDSVSPNNLVIDAGSYVVLDLEYTPNINAEAGEDQLFAPIAQYADLNLSTSLGIYTVDLLGATGGLEPQLKVVTLTSDESTTELLDDPCKQAKLVEIESLGAALDFGVANIFTGWIPEDFTEKKLVLCNTGSGSKPLKVWTNPINDGYFTFAKQDPETTYPLVIAPNSSKTLKMRYAPTPDNNNPSVLWDFGQLVLMHNGGNGPENPIILLGQQKSAPILDVTQNDIPIKTIDHQNPYGESSGDRKKLQCAKIGADTIKSFGIINRSKKYKLKSNVEISDIKAVNIDDKGNSSLIDVNAKVNINGSLSSVIETNPDSNSLFELTINVADDVKDGTEINGLMMITHEFEGNGGKATLPKYEVYFKFTASKSGECPGGSGDPLDGPVVMIIDRITMNLFGLTEPARNPPAFKFHMPLDLDLEDGWARIQGLSYDPLKVPSPVKQIRSYAHQLSNVTSCFPLPTNPYKLEFEPGSWDGPKKNCGVVKSSVGDEFVIADSSAVCAANNGAQIYEDPVTGKKSTVFYHEFMKLGDSCAPEIEGKISTFVLEEGETIPQVFKRMEKEKGLKGTEDDYAEITKPYSFDSYIKFNINYNVGNCNHTAAEEPIRDPDEIKKCWEAFKTDKSNFQRKTGMIEECTYFQFEIDKGCAPGEEDDLTANPQCEGVDFDDPTTWIGYGEYEKDIDEPDTQYHLTLRNVHIRAFTLVHSLNSFFDGPARVLFSDLFVTLTTKGVGRSYPETPNHFDDKWDDLIAENTKKDFDFEDTVRNIDEVAKTYWIEDFVNNQFVVGNGGEFDDEDCFEFDDDYNIIPGSFSGTPHCRGNYQIVNSKLVHSGEPISFDQKNRLLLVGLSGFHGKGNLAPSFAAEDSATGKGQSLYFTFHGCLKQPDEIIDGVPQLAETAGCYEPMLDKALGMDILSEYQNIGILSGKDLESDNESSKAKINFKIFDEDRNRLTNYYDANPFEFNAASRAKSKSPCGFGM